MNSFFEALTNVNFPFLRNALFAGLLSSILFGILGSVVTVRRIGSLAGAVSHAVLGGIGMALYLSATIIPGFPPIIGALIFVNASKKLFINYFHYTFYLQHSSSIFSP